MGEVLLERGVQPFNPDEAAKRFLSSDSSLTLQAANAAAWREGVRLLRRAIAGRLNFAFETTLGGHTITSILESAAFAGTPVRMWYVALRSPELHIQRVRARVARGGHDIPEQKIRERYNQSRSNLIRLLPVLMDLRVYDNSHEADPSAGRLPKPRLILHFAHRRVIAHCELRTAPAWTKPILMEALKLERSGPS
jgi:predicted ABC-type ATPase